VSSNHFQVCLVLATLALTASCESRPEDSLGPCSPPATEIPLPVHVSAKFAPIDLQLPRGSVEAREQEGTRGSTQNWTGPDGLVVGYSVRTDLAPNRGARFGTETFVQCTEKIGGVVANIRMVYSERTTAAGQYISARWALNSRTWLVLGASYPDSTHNAELLAIVRSVRIREPSRSRLDVENNLR
jgi:hypothetical protein